MELFRISKNKKIKVYVKEDQDKNISVSSLKYINLELENTIIYTYKNLIDNMDKSAQNLMLNYIDKIKQNNLENIQMNLIEDSIEKNLMELNLITSNDICFSNIIILFIINLKSIKFQNDSHIFIASLFRHGKIFRNYYKMLMEVICPLLINSIKIENYEYAESIIMIYYYINSMRSLRLIPNENLFKYIKKFESIVVANANKINEVENSNNKNLVNDDEEFINYIYIQKNFTSKKFIPEEEILQYKNNLLNEVSKSELEEGIKNRKNIKFNPRITSTNKKLKLDFDILSQIEIFSKIKECYNNYILNGLDNKNLNLIDILEICANIIIYFKYMEEFVEKDEVNNILYEIYNSYLDLYIEQMGLYHYRQPFRWLRFYKHLYLNL